MSEPAVQPNLIRFASGEADMDTARRLFRDYQAFLQVDLCFQGFEDELRDLPGKYAGPTGCILFAEVDGVIAGCIAVRPIDDHPAGPGVCEMKRLFLYDAYRGLGIGRTLAIESIGVAARAGHHTMCLDTLERLGPALSLYDSLGFRKCPPYTPNPESDVLYFEKPLGPG